MIIHPLLATQGDFFEECCGLRRVPLAALSQCTRHARREDDEVVERVMPSPIRQPELVLFAARRLGAKRLDPPLHSAVRWTLAPRLTNDKVRRGMAVLLGKYAWSYRQLLVQPRVPDNGRRCVWVRLRSTRVQLFKFVRGSKSKCEQDSHNM